MAGAGADPQLLRGDDSTTANDLQWCYQSTQTRSAATTPKRWDGMRMTSLELHLWSSTTYN